MAGNKTVVIDVVALVEHLISPEHTPFLDEFTKRSPAGVTKLEPAFPALTCTAQATYLSGRAAGAHGIAGNGWFDRTYCEIKNWHQSSKNVLAQRLWTDLKREAPGATVFVNGWWHGMYDDDVDYFINVRPQYLQDGGKKPDIYAKPETLRGSLQSKFGLFPLHRFWGPGAGIAGSQWIADASIEVDKQYDPTLSFIYLPHLDYCLQLYGPDDADRVPKALAEIDTLLKSLVGYYESRGARVLLLSEYGIEPVSRPVYLNRVLREAGLVQIRDECGGETLDYGACDAFALCDHQVAHVYLNERQNRGAVKRLLAGVDGVGQVLEPAELDAMYATHAPGTVRRSEAHHDGRSGDLVCIAAEGTWFPYYYWFDDAKAPDYARCVAIHKKPGYDPAEMLFRYPFPFGLLWLLLKLVLVYGLRLRACVDATPLDCTGIRGSHGRFPTDRYKPVLISSWRAKDGTPGGGTAKGRTPAEDVRQIILDHVLLA